MQAFTLWEFRSPSTPQIVRSMRYTDMMDREYQHEYQKVLWRGQAPNPKEAWFKSGFEEKAGGV